MAICLRVQLTTRRRDHLTRTGRPRTGHDRFVHFLFEVCPSQPVETADEAQLVLDSGTELVGRALHTTPLVDLGDGGEKGKVVLADRLRVLWPDEVRHLLEVPHRVARQDADPGETPEARAAAWDTADPDVGAYVYDSSADCGPAEEELDAEPTEVAPGPVVPPRTESDAGEPDRWWDTAPRPAPRPERRTSPLSAPRHADAVVGPQPALGLVVCVTQNPRPGEVPTKTYPLELPLGMDLAEFDSYLDRRLEVHGYRLWLEGPRSAVSLGISNLAPDTRVRRIEKRVPWRLTHSNHSSVEVWSRSTVVDVDPEE